MYSNGGTSTVTGQEYGNGVYEYRSDRNKNTYSNNWGKVFQKWIYKSGSGYQNWGFYTNHNRNTDGTYDNNTNDSPFDGIGYTKDGYVGTWGWIMLPTKIYLTGFKIFTQWMSVAWPHDFRIYARNSTATDPSSQANRIYTTEAANDWVFIYEHQSDIDLSLIHI